MRLALQARGVREQPADRRRVRRALDVPVERVLEVELARVAQLHDRRGRERLRDRADAVLRVRRRLDLRLDVRGADRFLPDELAVAEDGGARLGSALVALRRPDSCSSSQRAVQAWTPSTSCIARSPLDLLVADVEMRDRAEPAGPEAADADAALEQALAQPRLVADRDEVRLDPAGSRPIPSASRRARAWSSASRST